ncbi:lysophospholipid acyltransferase family protein [Bowmanella pacifica]|uniref:Acyltransferase n=1 Tax=Bowmanella pacifica TaxID=502051 RepID=A0A917YSS3_9ALTE|nr:lysophospholipid acyltransferase family protein [Bowmanella pacifica]GGO65931.1 acyltransferase [Bowmanella pacifica]
MANLNRIWRFFATAFCFSLFGLGGLFLALIWFPLCNLFYSDQARKRANCRAIVRQTFGFFVTVMCWVGVIRVSLEEAQKLRALSGKVVIANHPSLIDVVVLISLIPNADCVVKSSLLRNPFMRGVIKATGYISNDNVDELLADCERSLSQGNNLIIFPEGTRTYPGQPCHFVRGAANIAIRTAKDFQLVFLRVEPPFLTKGLPWYKVPARRVDFMLRVAGTYNVHPYLSDNVTGAVRKLTKDIENLFIQELKNDRSTEGRA